MIKQDVTAAAGACGRGKRRYIALFVPVLLIAAIAGLLLLRSNAAASPLGGSLTRTPHNRRLPAPIAGATASSSSAATNRS